jgi:hypothetical protein
MPYVMFCHSVDSLSLAGRREVYISRLGNGVEYACDDFVATIEVSVILTSYDCICQHAACVHMKIHKW